MKNKISLYTQLSLIPEGKVHATILNPFAGNFEADANDPEYGRFDEYTSNGQELFSLTDTPVEADFFLLAFEFSFVEEHVNYAKQFSEMAKEYGKKLLIFFNSDSAEPIPIENCIVFRTSFFKSLQKNNEFAIPGWSVDFMKSKGIRNLDNSFSNQPSISYCGYVDYLSFTKRFSIEKVIAKLKNRSSIVKEIGPGLRGKAVRKLLKSNQIKTNFIIRNGFWAPGMDKKKARQEYMDNILQSDYALVARGGGNFSYRLYEVLSCGRIPVFINTDCVLPFDTIIDWKNYVVWIEETDIAAIAERLIEYHKKL
ncbi:MAG: exostosin family protein, partial [Bacteroidetes bacterium]|nr:exostosin family protein [Bacteroidota bacterium]